MKKNNRFLLKPLISIKTWELEKCTLDFHCCSKMVHRLLELL